MDKMNFKALGPALYGFVSKYFNEYLENPPAKEDFVEKMKEGKLSYDNISLKKEKELEITRNFKLTSGLSEKIEIVVPDETNQLQIRLSNTKFLFTLFNSTSEHILNALYTQKVTAIENFIANIIEKIESKSSSFSLINNIINSIVANVLKNGLLFEIQNFTIMINFGLHSVNLIVKNFTFNGKDKIVLEGVSLALSNKYNFFECEKINFSLQKDLENSLALVDVSHSGEFYAFFPLDLTSVIDELIKMYSTERNLIENEKRKLILSYKPSETDYKLNEEDYVDIATKYLTNKDKNKKIEEVILVENFILIENSRTTVEERLIKNKNKKPTGFFGFFGGGGKDKEEEGLSDEEKGKLDEIYKKENLMLIQQEDVLLKKLQEFKIFDELLSQTKNFKIKYNFYQIGFNFPIAEFKTFSLTLNNIEGSISNGNYEFSLDDIQLNKVSMLWGKKEKFFICKYNSKDGFEYKINMEEISLKDKLLIYLIKFISRIDFSEISSGEKSFNIEEIKIEDYGFLNKFLNSVPKLNLLLSDKETISLCFGEVTIKNDVLTFYISVSDKMNNQVLPHFGVKVIKSKINDTYTVLLEESLNIFFGSNLSEVFYCFLKEVDESIIKKEPSEEKTEVKVKMPRIDIISKEIHLTFQEKGKNSICIIQNLNVSLEKNKMSQKARLVKITVHPESLPLLDFLKKNLQYPSEEFKEGIKKRKLEILKREPKETNIYQSKALLIQTDENKFQGNFSFDQFIIEFVSFVTITTTMNGMTGQTEGKSCTFKIEKMEASTNDGKTENRFLVFQNPFNFSYSYDTDRYFFSSSNIHSYMTLKTLYPIVKSFMVGVPIDFYIYGGNFLIDFKNINLTTKDFTFFVGALTSVDGIKNFENYFFELDMTQVSIFNHQKQVLNQDKMSSTFFFPSGNVLNIEGKSGALSIDFTEEELHFYIVNLITQKGYLKEFQELFGTSEQSMESFNVSLDIFLPKIDLNLFLEGEQFSIISFHNSQLSLKESINLDFLIGNLQVTYFDWEKTSFVLLSDSGESPETQQIAIHKRGNNFYVNINSSSIILRIDAYLAIVSYFMKSIPFDMLYDRVRQVRREMEFEMNIVNMQFILFSAFDFSEKITIVIRQVFFYYKNTNKNKFPFGDLTFNISSIKNTILSEKENRLLFECPDNFMVCGATINESFMKMSLKIGNISLNLSYSDVLSFLKAYQLNLFYFKQDKRINKKALEGTVMQKGTGLITSIIAVFLIEKMEIIIIDNSENNYFPFIELIISNFETNLSKEDNITFDFSLTILSYNYIACEWEPSIEKTHIVVDYLYKKKEYKNFSFTLNIDEALLNFSDMNISFVFVSLNNWIDKLFLAIDDYVRELNIFRNRSLKAPKENPTIFTDPSLLKSSLTKKPSSTLKISNNKIINFSGEEITIDYHGALYNMTPQGELPLEYRKEFTQKNSFSLIYKNNRFNLPIEKIRTIIHKVDNDFFFISEISLSKAKSIDIRLYSPIIFHNRTSIPVVVTLILCQDKKYIIVLSEDSKFGVPCEFQFGHFLVSNDPEISDLEQGRFFPFEEVVSTPTNGIYQKQIILSNNPMMLKIDRTIPNVRTIVITAEYSIVNCLPCQIQVLTNENVFLIEKCSKKDIYLSKNMQLTIQLNISHDKFSTRHFQWFEYFKGEGNKVLQLFKINQKEKSWINLMAMCKVVNGRKELILYSEYYFKNITGIDYNIIYEKDQNSICQMLNNDSFFPINEKDINGAEFILFSSSFSTSKFKINQVLESDSNYILRMRMQDKVENSLDFQVYSKLTFIPISNYPSFTEEIHSMVMTISPLYQIVNILPNKKVFFSPKFNTKHNQVFEVLPNKKVPFHFFLRGTNLGLNIGICDMNKKRPSSWSGSFYCNEITVYTFFLDNCFFNVEIKENSNGIRDIFITETDLKKCRYSISNQTTNCVVVQQIGFSEQLQVIEPGKEEIIKIYSYAEPEIEINVKNVTKTFSLRKNKGRKDIIKDVILNQETNGYKSTFFLIEKKMGSLKTGPEFIFNIYIKNLGISLISDSEYKRKGIQNYERMEILFMLIQDFNTKIIYLSNYSILNDSLTFQTIIKTMTISNQLNENGKFEIPFRTKGPIFFNCYTQLIVSTKDRLATISCFNLNLGDIKVGIDPPFCCELLDLFSGILYRMNFASYNVDEMFLLGEKKDIRKEYQDANSFVIQAENIELPNMKFSFELSQIDLEYLLRDKFHCTSFYNYVISNLSGKSHSITLKKDIIRNFIGGYNEIVEAIILKYYFQILGNFTKIGVTGFFRGFVKIFAPNEKETALKNEYRLRIPRAFYGRYKAFRNYNKEHAIIHYRIQEIFKEYHFTNFFDSERNCYVFTTISLLLCQKNPFNAILSIDYVFIKDAKKEGNRVTINYNQKIDGVDSFSLSFKNEGIALRFVEMVMEERNKNLEEIQNLS